MIAAATLTCEFLSSNSFVIAAISSGSTTASKGGVGPLDLSNIIPVYNGKKVRLLFDNSLLLSLLYYVVKKDIIATENHIEHIRFQIQPVYSRQENYFKPSPH